MFTSWYVFFRFSGDYSNALLHYEKGVTKLPEVMAGCYLLFGVFLVQIDALLFVFCYLSTKTIETVKVISRNKDTNTVTQ